MIDYRFCNRLQRGFKNVFISGGGRPSEGAAYCRSCEEELTCFETQSDRFVDCWYWPDVLVAAAMAEAGGGVEAARPVSVRLGLCIACQDGLSAD